MDFRACVRTGFQNPVPQVRLKTNSGCSHGILVHSPGSSKPGVALGNFQSSLSGTRTSVLGLEFLHFGRAWTSQIWGNTRIFGRHGAGALYQGTTLVGPLRLNKRFGL